MVGMNYKPAAEDEAPPGSGKVARLPRSGLSRRAAERLKGLLAWLQSEKPDCRGRAVVDTAPLLRAPDFARRAGLGWIGKNTMLLDKRLGSYFFLGELLVDITLQPTARTGPIIAAVHAQSRCMPYPGVPGSGRPRCSSLHQLSHHRA